MPTSMAEDKANQDCNALSRDPELAVKDQPETYFDTTTGQCRVCPNHSVAFYQQRTEVDDYFNVTTIVTEPIGIEGCHCSAGYELVAGLCLPCPGNFYKGSIHHTRCTACPQHTRAEQYGSTSPLDCLCGPKRYSTYLGMLDFAKGEIAEYERRIRDLEGPVRERIGFWEDPSGTGEVRKTRFADEECLAAPDREYWVLDTVKHQSHFDQHQDIAPIIDGKKVVRAYPVSYTHLRAHET